MDVPIPLGWDVFLIDQRALNVITRPKIKPLFSPVVSVFSCRPAGYNPPLRHRITGSLAEIVRGGMA